MSSLLAQSLRRFNLLLELSPLPSTRCYWSEKTGDSPGELYPLQKRVLPIPSRGLVRPMCWLLILTRSLTDLKRYHVIWNPEGLDAERVIHY